MFQTVIKQAASTQKMWCDPVSTEEITSPLFSWGVIIIIIFHF